MNVQLGSCVTREYYLPVTVPKQTAIVATIVATTVPIQTAIIDDDSSGYRGRSSKINQGSAEIIDRTPVTSHR